MSPQYLLLLLVMPADFAPSGFIDVASRKLPSAVTAVGSDGDRLAVATFESGRATLSIYNAQLTRLSQMQLPKPSLLLALFRNQVLTAERAEGGVHVCLYDLNSENSELTAAIPCTAAPGNPAAIGFAQGTPEAIGSDWSFRWESGSWRKHPLPWIGGDGPLLSTVGDRGAIRLSSTTGRGEIIQAGKQIIQHGDWVSPDSAKRNESRALSQLLWSRVFWFGDGEVWVQRGSWHVTTGFAFDRFDPAGQYLGAQFLPIPRYPELISNPEVGPKNPTGDLVPSAVLPLGKGVAVVDFRGKRAVLYLNSTNERRLQVN